MMNKVFMHSSEKKMYMKHEAEISLHVVVGGRRAEGRGLMRFQELAIIFQRMPRNILYFAALPYPQFITFPAIPTIPCEKGKHKFFMHAKAI